MSRREREPTAGYPKFASQTRKESPLTRHLTLVSPFVIRFLLAMARETREDLVPIGMVSDIISRISAMLYHPSGSISGCVHDNADRRMRVSADENGTPGYFALIIL